MQKQTVTQPSLRGPSLSESEFRRFREFIYRQCGINLSPGKKTMLSIRLNKRLRALGMTSFGKYFDYVAGREGRREELAQMINVVSTNKTDFFREQKHFDYLAKKALPALFESWKGASSRGLNLWSAGCSSGEEPYTLAMVLEEFFEKRTSRGYSLLATDISTRVLGIAQKAIYPEDSIQPIPAGLRRKYLMRGNGTQSGFCRVVPELRKRVDFQRLNLIEGRNFAIRKEMDVIFCRNVIIYFDRETQTRLFGKFYDQLAPGGYMFIGHSETLNGINDRFVPVTVAVYRKPH